MKKILFLAAIGLMLGGCSIPFLQKNKNNTSDANIEEEGITDESSVSEEGEEGQVDGANNAVEEKNPADSMNAEQKKAAESRDKQRLADIKTIQDALEKYFKENKNSYPQEIESLVPKYLKALPKNPTPGGEDYSYTPIGSEPVEYYDLTYTLEVGVDGAEWGQQSASPEVAEEVEVEAEE